MESLRQEKTSGGLSSYLLPKAGYDTNSNQVVRTLIRLCLENFQGRIIFTVILFYFLIATLNLPPLQLKATTSCFPATSHCEGPGPISLLVLGAAVGCPSSCPFSRLNKPRSLTLSSPYKCSK